MMIIRGIVYCDLNYWEYFSSTSVMQNSGSQLDSRNWIPASHSFENKNAEKFRMVSTNLSPLVAARCAHTKESNHLICATILLSVAGELADQLAGLCMCIFQIVVDDIRKVCSHTFDNANL